MSLIDSVLLDPYPFEIYVAKRTDGAKGSGTLNDPFDGSTTELFDGILSNLNTTNVGITVHLGPGTFKTKGYADGVSGCWEALSNMRIIGAGADITTLQMDPAQTWVDNKQYFLIGHKLSGESNASNPVDFFELSHLTLDCNQPAASPVACGAVRVMGNHLRIHRVKAKKFGNRSDATGFVFAVLGADSGTQAQVVDSGLEDCIAIEPSSATTKETIIFHVGDVSLTSSSAASPQEFFGKGLFIRNCFVDCGWTGVNDDYLDNFHALSIASCIGGIVEGNQIHNIPYGGPYLKQWNARTTIIRNNFYKNVVFGPNFPLDTSTVGKEFALASLCHFNPPDSLKAEAVTQAGQPHNLNPGDRVLIYDASRPEFNGVFIVTDTYDDNPLKFNYRLFTDTGNWGSATGAKFKKVVGVEKLIIEGNWIEISSQVTSPTPIGINLQCDASVAQPSAFRIGDAIIRNNKILYLDGKYESTWSGYALDVVGARNLLVHNNIVQCAPRHSLQNAQCGSVHYQNNKNTDGQLIQGYNRSSETLYNELETDNDLACVLALFNKR